MKKKFSYIVVVSLLVGLLMPQTSFAMLPTIDALNIFQTSATALNSAKNIVNQAKQIQNQILSVKNQYNSLKNQATLLQTQAKNLKNVKTLSWRNISGYLNDISRLSNQGQAIAATMKNIDRTFTQRFPNYLNSQFHVDYQTAYKNWSSTTLSTLKNTLTASGHTALKAKDEAAVLEQLKTQCKTAEGRMQALQITSEISAENVNQLQALKSLITAQTNSQSAYMAYKVSKNTYEEKGLQKTIDEIDTKFPAYHENPAFGEISTTQ